MAVLGRDVIKMMVSNNRGAQRHSCSRDSQEAQGSILILRNSFVLDYERNYARAILKPTCIDEALGSAKYSHSTCGQVRYASVRGRVGEWRREANNISEQIPTTNNGVHLEFMYFSVTLP